MGATATLKMLLLGEDRSAGSTLRNVGNEAEHAGSRLHGAGTMVAGFAVAGTAALAAAGVAAVGFGLKTAAANEQAQISFTTMLGSAAKAKTFLGDLQKFAATTPFEFPELQTAASSLISAGINANKVIPIMTTLGDVTSGMGTGAEGVQRATIALQQMNAAGKITGEDLNQLRDAGIPVYDLLASALGKTKSEVVDLAQKGKLGGDALTKMMKALETGKGLERFSGLMDKQSQSLSGMVSTFKDTLGQGLATAVTPLIPLIKDGLVGATTALSVALPYVVDGLEGFVHGIEAVHDFIGPLFHSLKSDGPSSMTPIASAAHGVVDAFRDLWVAVAPIVHTIVQTIRENWGPISAWVKQTFGQIVQAISLYLQIIAAEIRAWAALISFVWQHWGTQITAYVKATFQIVAGVITGALRIITGIFKVIHGLLTGDWRELWSGIKSIVSGAWKIITSLVSGSMAQMRAIFSAGINALVGLAKGIGGKIKGAVGDLGHVLYQAGVSVIQGLISGVKSMVKPLTDTLHSITNMIPMHKGPISKDRKLLTPAGVAIMRGLVDGIESGKVRLATALDKITAFIGSKNETIQDLLSKQADMASGMQGFTSSLFGADMGREGALTVGDILGYQQTEEAKAASLADEVGRLTGMGLSSSLIQQMVGSGAGGVEKIHALSGATPQQIAALNASNAGTLSSLARAGGYAGNAVYGGELAAARRDQATAEAVRKELEKLMTKHDKNHVIAIHLEGRTIQRSLLQLKRSNGNQSLGLS